MKLIFLSLLLLFCINSIKGQRVHSFKIEGYAKGNFTSSRQIPQTMSASPYHSITIDNTDNTYLFRLNDQPEIITPISSLESEEDAVFWLGESNRSTKTVFIRLEQVGNSQFLRFILLRLDNDIDSTGVMEVFILTIANQSSTQQNSASRPATQPRAQQNLLSSPIAVNRDHLMKYRVGLYSEPSNTSRFIAEVPPNTQIKILYDVGPYYYVDYNGQKGYIAKVNFQ